MPSLHRESTDSLILYCQSPTQYPVIPVTIQLRCGFSFKVRLCISIIANGLNMLLVGGSMESKSYGLAICIIESYGIE